jgi:putative transposase
LIAKEWISHGFYTTRILNLLSLPRSTHYDRRKEKQVTATTKRGRPIPGFSLSHEGNVVPDEQIEEYLMEYACDDNIGGLGYKKWTTLLQTQYHIKINKKKVYRMCSKLGILKERKTRKAKHPRRIARNRIITGRNQLWQVDIKYASIANTNYFIFICSAIDVYDREIVGYYRGPSCRAKDITNMLTKALIRRKVHFKEGEWEDKLIIRTDNGPQFVSDLYGDFCQHHKVYHERIPNKSPNMNAYIESFHSCIQRECLDRHPFTFFEEGYYHIDAYMAFYNEVRPHGSLMYHAPHVFSELNAANKITIEAISL